MDWFRVDVSTVSGPEWLRIHPALRGHWLSLVAYCAERENGGLIKGARDYTNRDWDRAAGLTKSVVRSIVSLELARWVNDDLEVCHYDDSAEKRLRKASEFGVKGAKSRWSRHRDPIRDPNRDPIGDPNGEPNAQDRTGQDKTRDLAADQLALVPPPAEKQRAKKQARKPSGGEPDPHHVAFRDWFQQRYQQEYQQPHSWSAREAGQTKTLLSWTKGDLRLLKARAEAMFRADWPDPPRDLGTLVQHFNRYGQSPRGSPATHDGYRDVADVRREIRGGA